MKEKTKTMNQKSARVCIYGRVAVGNEKTNSLDKQLSDCTSFCEENGWDVVQTFADNGKSGVTIDRAELQQMVEFVTKKSNHIDIVLVQNVSRLTRDTADFVKLGRLLKKAGVALRSVAEERIASVLEAHGAAESLEAAFYDSLSAAMKQFQRAALSRRIKEGIRRSRAATE